MAAQAFVNFGNIGTANNQPTTYVAADGFTTLVQPLNPNSPTFAAANFPAGVAFPGSSTGSTTITSANASATNYTVNIPAVSGTLAMTSGANLAIIDTYRCTTAQTANANVVPASITGLSGAVAVGTYEFEAALYCTVASGTAGIAINQVLTTAVLGVCNFEAAAFLAAGIATQATTTATSGTALFTAADQPILILIKGSFTVTTAGTFGLQMCQNTSNASNSVVNVGSTMKLTRIA